MRRLKLSLTWIFFLFFIIAGCTTTTPTAKLHHTIKNTEQKPQLKQIVLLPVDIDIYELSMGGVKEEVPEWSSKVEENIHQALLFSNEGKCSGTVHKAVSTSDLTSEEREILEEHLALFSSVSATAIWTTSSFNKPWNFKQDHFDYTIGDGLRFLKTKYDIDAGLIIIGEETVSTAGRQAAAAFGAVLFGIYIPIGNAVLIGGLVDFETGNLLWMDYRSGGAGINLRELDTCKDFVEKLVEGYPIGLIEATSDQ